MLGRNVLRTCLHEYPTVCPISSHGPLAADPTLLHDNLPSLIKRNSWREVFYTQVTYIDVIA